MYINNKFYPRRSDHFIAIRELQNMYLRIKMRRVNVNNIIFILSA